MSNMKNNLDIFLIISLINIVVIHLYFSNYASFIKGSGGLGRIGTILITLLTSNILMLSIYKIFLFVLKTLDTNKKIYGIFVSIPIYLIVWVLLEIILICKAIIILTDTKKHRTTLINCTIYRGHYFSTLVGVSKEGNKNTFRLIGKDGEDVYRMIYNGVYNFEIYHYMKSKQIVLIKPIIPNNNIMR